MIAIEMKGITKRFPGMIANDRIDFSVEQGEIHCLLGENGAGKSTLMNVLFGLYKPEEGEIYIKGEKIDDMHPNKAYDLGIGMVHQHFMLIDNLTVLENIILGDEPGEGTTIDRKKARETVQALSDRYQFNLKVDELVRNLSVGEMQRVEIMKTLYRGAEIIILDEPTAVLTPLEVDHLLNILRDIRAEGKTIIFITHKLNETMAVSGHVTILRSGKSVLTVATSDTSERKLAGEMVGTNLDFEITKQDRLVSEKRLLELKGIKLLPNSENPADLYIREGEILGIAGVDGNGQSELEEIVVGIRPTKEGSIHFHGEDVTNHNVRTRRKEGLAYIPADRWKYGIVQTMSLYDNFLLGHQYEDEFVKNGIIQHKYLEERTEEAMKEFDVRAVGPEQFIGSLSGGNQQKLVLGREMESEPNIVIASQPTRGLDIGAQQFIKNILVDLRDQGKAVLLISAELTDLFELSDRIAVLYKGEVMATKDTNEYDNESISLLMAGKKEV